MPLNLYWTTFTLGVGISVLGILLVGKFHFWEHFLKRFGRSPLATYITVGSALACFMWILVHLGEADFGEYKNWLMLLFGAVGLLSFYYVPDFLSVRGLSMLGLIGSSHVLDAAYMRPEQARLWLVGLVYAWIIFCIFMGAFPYLWRDLWQWAYASALRVRLMGIIFLSYGVGLAGIALKYLHP